MEGKEPSTASPSAHPSPTTPGTSSPLSSPAHSPPGTKEGGGGKKKKTRKASAAAEEGATGRAENNEGGGAGGGLTDGEASVPGSPGATKLESRQRTIVDKDGKSMQRFTLSEAADEIKRLRRLVKQYKGDLKKAEDDLQTSQTQIGRLEAENVEAQKRVQMKEEDAARLSREIDELNKGLDIAAEELRVLQATSLPLNEARKLTYKALRKGRALQCLADLFSKNQMTENLVKEGFNGLVENAFGAAHLAARLERGGYTPGVHAAADAQLRLFRQEQLLLLAENERLTQQVRDLQEAITVAMSQKEAAGGEAVLQFSLPLQQREKLARLGILNRDGEGLDGVLDEVQKREERKKCQREFHIQACLLQAEFFFRVNETRLLSWGLRRMCAHAVHEADAVALKTSLKQTARSWKDAQAALCARYIRSVLSALVRRRLEEAFLHFAVNAKADPKKKNRVGGRFVVNNRRGVPTLLGQGREGEPRAFFPHSSTSPSVAHDEDDVQGIKSLPPFPGALGRGGYGGGGGFLRGRQRVFPQRRFWI